MCFFEKSISNFCQSENNKKLPIILMVAFNTNICKGGTNTMSRYIGPVFKKSRRYSFSTLETGKELRRKQ